MPDPNDENFSRRDFFSGIAQRLTSRIVDAASAFEKSTAESAASSPSQPAPYLRPPGAVAEATFTGICGRSGECAQACPYEAIIMLGSDQGIAAGTPAIFTRESPCYLCEDLPCITACDTGALQPVPRQDVRMGIARIDLGRCIVSQGQLCDYCVLRCPLERHAIDWDANRLPEILDPGCAGCGVCDYLCPADAIIIEAVPE